MLLLVYQQQHVVVGLPTCCCRFTNNNMLLLVYQHVVVGLPTTTCCCWFTNMLLSVYQQQHVVVGLPTCCCWYISQPTPPTPTHQGIPWNVEGFPLSWCVVFPSVILSLHVMIVLHCLLWIKPGDQDGPDCRNVSRVYRSIPGGGGYSLWWPVYYARRFRPPFSSLARSHRVHFRAWLDPIGSIFELGSIP